MWVVDNEEHKKEQKNTDNENEATETPLFLDSTASTPSSTSPNSMQRINRNKLFHSMKTSQRGKHISRQQSSFARMRLRPKLTKKTEKTASTTNRPEIFESRETKNIPSVETISPHSIIPVTVTPETIIILEKDLIHPNITDLKIVSPSKEISSSFN